MSTDEQLAALVGKTVARIDDETNGLIFTDGSALLWDYDGIPEVYTAEEWSRRMGQPQ